MKSTIQRRCDRSFAKKAVTVAAQIATATGLTLTLGGAQAQINDVSTFYGKGMSNDGTVVGGYASGDVPKLWVGVPATGVGTITDLPKLSGASKARVYGVSGNGQVSVGISNTATGGLYDYHAVLWYNGSIFDLGSLGVASGKGEAYAVSDNGTAVAGRAYTADGRAHGFRWFGDPTTGVGVMTQLPELTGGNSSVAEGISGNGLVPVGNSNYVTNSSTVNAVRWVNGAVENLGLLTNGSNSFASAASFDGSVVVGGGDYGAGYLNHAFRWVSGATGGIAGNPQMYDLGTLGGNDSWAIDVSPDGRVVVGYAKDGTGNYKGFRWSQSAGMRSVEQWLTDSGVTVGGSISTQDALAISADKTIIMGTLSNGHIYIAVGSNADSVTVTNTPGPQGLLDLTEANQSIANTQIVGLARVSNLLQNGLHGNPMSHRVPTGKKTFWVAGDLGEDNHQGRRGKNGLGEFGIGYNFGSVQVNAAIGRVKIDQKMVFNGSSKTDGNYLHVEALKELKSNLWSSLGAYYIRGSSAITRGYLNAGLPDFSSSSPKNNSWGIRLRVENDGMYQIGLNTMSPYLDVSYSESKLAAYTETGGGFAARFDARKEKSTELRLGVNSERPLINSMSLISKLEVVHQFERHTANSTGELLGLMNFDVVGEAIQKNWLRAGIGTKGQLGGGEMSVMLNATSKSSAPSYWLAASWQRSF